MYDDASETQGVEISLKVLLIMNSSKVNLKHRNESQLTEKME